MWACTWRTCHSRLGARLTVALPSPLSCGRPRRGGSPSSSRGFSAAVFTLVFLGGGCGGSPAGSLGFSASCAAAPSLSDETWTPWPLAELRVVVPVVIICACWASQGAVAIPPIGWFVFRDFFPFLTHSRPFPPISRLSSTSSARCWAALSAPLRYWLDHGGRLFVAGFCWRGGGCAFAAPTPSVAWS